MLFSLEPCFEFFGNGKYGLFCDKKLVERWIHWLLKISCFELFHDGKYGLLWGKEFMERWYLLVTEKFLFWAFPWREIRLWKYDIYWLLKSSCFELFGDGKCSLFLFQKVDIKIIFTWYFWVFRDIPGPEKYGFSCSGFSTCIFSFFLFVYILRFAFLCFMSHYMDKVR